MKHRGNPDGTDSGHLVLGAGAMGLARFTKPAIIGVPLHQIHAATSKTAAIAQLVEDKPLWIDIASVNGVADLSKAVGVVGVIPRAAISWGYKDAQFASNYAQALELGWYVSSYHVLYTDQPIVRQADNWYEAHDQLNHINPIPRVIDFEVDRGESWARKADALMAMSDLVLQRDGLRPLIYTRYLLANTWLSSLETSELNDHFWWMAQYLWDRRIEHPGPPTPPNHVDPENIVLQQTADMIPGWPGTVQSAALDRDRWQLGNDAEMRSWIAQNWGGDDPVEPTHDEKVEIMWGMRHSH